jgi:hypothetical protein
MDLQVDGRTRYWLMRSFRTLCVSNPKVPRKYVQQRPERSIAVVVPEHLSLYPVYLYPYMCSLEVAYGPSKVFTVRIPTKHAVKVDVSVSVLPCGNKGA